MVKRRRLGDLYQLGTEFKTDDGQGEVTVWLQKLNPTEVDSTLRRSSAARAKYLLDAKDKESEGWQAAYADVHEFAPSREILLTIALRDDLRRMRAAAEAELSAEDEWSKDDRLQAIMDAWEGTTEGAQDGGEQTPLKEVHLLKDESDPRWGESQQVWAELQKFNTAVEKIVLANRDNLFHDWSDVPDEELVEKAVEKIIDEQATGAMLMEYETQELFYAVREPDDHSKRYFGTRDEVVALSDTMRSLALARYRLLMVDHQEGKDLPEIPGSSPLSDSSVPEETPVSSGPVVVVG